MGQDDLGVASVSGRLGGQASAVASTAGVASTSEVIALPQARTNSWFQLTRLRAEAWTSRSKLEWSGAKE